MADDKNKRGKSDRNKVAASENYEIDYLKKKFDVSGQQVAGAIRAVGNNRVAVEKYLKEAKKRS